MLRQESLTKHFQAKIFYKKSFRLNYFQIFDTFLYQLKCPRVDVIKHFAFAIDAATKKLDKAFSGQNFYIKSSGLN